MTWDYEDVDPDWTKPPERAWSWIVLTAVVMTEFASWLLITPLG
ncbi:hypothetical protein OCOJLMKI_0642 [Methylobacterium iners]|uniref:Uncharacterized protein n=1 Tax=Methylobacterium iners TaxID=418707 RepID=A0ABQ4RTF6_9HYPH|nr:hypothetical protein OCOJLMKI_0642 [Methylobacterium iners]